MPALRLRSGQAPAGIQGDSAPASGSASWIPGPALLAWNDVPAGYPSSVLWGVY